MRRTLQSHSVELQAACRPRTRKFSTTCWAGWPIAEEQVFERILSSSLRNDRRARV